MMMQMGLKQRLACWYRQLLSTSFLVRSDVCLNGKCDQSAISVVCLSLGELYDMDRHGIAIPRACSAQFLLNGHEWP